MLPKILLPFFTLLLWSLLSTNLSAQRVLLLEKYGRDKSERLMEGDEMTFQMRGDDFWQTGIIAELRPDIQAAIINDRFIMLEEIAALKFSGSRFANRIGFSLITFGVGWSTFALLGYATDGDPTTNYGVLDLGTTLVSAGTGILLRQLFNSRKFKQGKRRKLRVVDLTF